MIKQLPRTTQIIQEQMAAGLHIGAQVYASLRGRVVADFALGESRPGVPMTPDTLMIWMSATKPIASVAIGQLWERGLLTLDDPIAKHIPEFAQNGKERITLRHILTHTAGIRWIETGWPTAPWEQIIAKINGMRIERGWVPGHKAGYSAFVTWFLLGEIVRLLDGRDYASYVRQEIFEPLGMKDSWIAMPNEIYHAYGNGLGIMQKTEGGVLRDLGVDTELACTRARPAGSGRGPMRELGRFYEMLLAGGMVPKPAIREGGAPAAEPPRAASRTDMPLIREAASGSESADSSNLRRTGASPSRPERILLPQTVEALVSRHRAGMYDLTFKHVLDWGLGFVLDSKQYGAETVPYGYGPHASRRTFGHSGMQSSCALADPEAGLATAMVFNGTPGEAVHDQRIRAVLASLYDELELAS